MHSDNYILGMSDEVRRMLLAGEAERSGGVIRRTDNKQIVVWLRDSDFEGERSLNEGREIGAIPVALLGASFFAIHKRLAVIESKLTQIQEKLEKVSSGLDVSNFKLDGMLLGELKGLLYTCALEIREGRTENLIHYRRKFIEKYHSIQRVVEGILFNDELLKDCADVFHEYLLAMILAGIAARDVSIYANEHDSSRAFSTELCSEIAKIEKRLTEKIRSPSALFWQREIHLDIVKSVRESRDRVLGHHAALNEIPREKINASFLECQKRE